MNKAFTPTRFIEIVLEIRAELSELPKYRYKSIPHREIYQRIPMSKGSYFEYLKECGMAPSTLQVVARSDSDPAVHEESA